MVSISSLVISSVGCAIWYLIKDDEANELNEKFITRCKLRPINEERLDKLIKILGCHVNERPLYVLGYNMREIIKYPNEEFDTCLEDMIQKCTIKYKVAKAD